MNNTSIFSLPTKEVKDNQPVVENGDCLLILKHDGRIVPLTVGIDIAELLTAVKAGEATEEQTEAFLRGRTLFALVLAVQNEAIMDVLLGIADNPDVIDPEALAALSRLH